MALAVQLISNLSAPKTGIALVLTLRKGHGRFPVDPPAVGSFGWLSTATQDIVFSTGILEGNQGMHRARQSQILSKRRSHKLVKGNMTRQTPSAATTVL